MTRPLVRAALLLPVLLALPLAGALRADEAEEARTRRAIDLARDRVYPALVNVSTVTREFQGGRVVRILGAGSGVIVSPAGHVLTNYHVAGETTRLSCMLPSGERIDADVVAHDPLTDLSVLKLRLEQRADPNRPLPFASIGDSDRLRVGDPVLAMGNPRGLSSSMTLGIVAAVNRVFKSFTGSDLEGMELTEGQPTGLFTRYIQHDAMIQPGNSGGPLVNLEGEVVGINELGGSGIGFAIPSNLAKEVLTRALTFGEIKRGWLGVTVQPVEALGRTDGALVASTLADGPIAKAGIVPGDVLLEVGPVHAAVPRLDDVPVFYAQVANLPIGSTQTVVYLRGGAGGERQEARVVVAPMERFLGEERMFDTWGVTALAITPPMAFVRGWPDTEGVLLTGVRPGKAPEVAKPSLAPGDVILEIGGKPVQGLDSFAALQKENAEAKDLLVRFRRGRADMVTALDLTKKPPKRGGKELAKAWMGAETQVMTPEVARALGMEGQKGYRITRVLPASASEKAGLRPGDVIDAIDGEALDASRLQDAEMLRRRIEDMDIGSEVVLRVIRDRAPIDVKVLLQETPSSAADAKSAEDEFLEYKVRELTYPDKVERDWPLDVKGLLVSETGNGGWANVAGLRTGDLLLTLHGTPIETIKEFEETTKRIAGERPARVILFVRRERATRFVFLEPEWPAK